MTIDEVTKLLWHHANYPNPARPDPGHSFVYLVKRSYESGESLPVSEWRAELMRCLGALNHYYNGPHPSAVVDPSLKASSFSRQIVGAMSVILRTGWESMIQSEVRGAVHASNVDELGTLVQDLAMAWEAVVDGDFDDLEQLVREVRWCNE